MFHVNMDKKRLPSSPTRRALATGTIPFLKKLHKLVVDCGQDVKYEDFEVHMVTMSALLSVPSINKDLSAVSFVKDNFTNSPLTNDFGNTPVNEILGIKYPAKGFPFLGCTAAGAWEESVFFIIYHDTLGLRAYIPELGNTYNTDFMTAFGSEGDTPQYTFNNVYNSQKYVDYFNTNPDSVDIDPMQIYCEIDGVSPEVFVGGRAGPDINPDAILEDLKANFHVDYDIYDAVEFAANPVLVSQLDDEEVLQLWSFLRKENLKDTENLTFKKTGITVYRIPEFESQFGQYDTLTKKLDLDFDATSF